MALDGDLLAIGAPNEDSGSTEDQGAVYLFQRNTQTASWSQVKKIVPADAVRIGWYGSSLALHGDTLVVGAPTATVDSVPRYGAVYIYRRNQGGANNWGLVRQLSEPGVGNSPNFGADVAFDGALLVVGASRANIKGAVYLYNPANTWSLITSLSDPTGGNDDEFGAAVALDGDTIVVGALRADVGQPFNNAGAAFVFGRNQGGANAWGQVAKLVASTPSESAEFGASVALEGDTILVGAPAEKLSGDDEGYEAGAAYLFKRSQGGANAWGRVQRLAAANAAASDQFGTDVALDGDVAWVGAPGSAAGGYIGQGYLHRYGRNGSLWSALPGREADDGSIGDRLGNALAIGGETLAVAAPDDDAGRGVVYLLDPHANTTQGSTQIFLPGIATSPFKATGTLENGKHVRIASGAIVGAVAGTLSAPMPIRLKATSAPAQSLGSRAKPVGSYYQLAAQRLIATPPDKPLLLGLPVPAGVDPNTLLMAILIPQGWVTGGRSAAVWSPSQGHYDAASKLFVATLGVMPTQSMTAVLISQPNMAIAQQRGAPQASPAFLVSCWLLDANSLCTPEAKEEVSQALVHAWDVFVEQQGFRRPRLTYQQGMFVGANLAPNLSLFERVRNIYIGTGPCVDGAGKPYVGRYHSANLMLELCLEPSFGQDYLQEVVRHELFHAVQFAYPGMVADWDQPVVGWTIEGTATAAERSDEIMLSTQGYEPWQVSYPFDAASLNGEYRVQDFWVAYGFAKNHELAYLQPIFEQGATAAHVAAAIDLKSAYWNAVKNVVMEKSSPVNKAYTTPPCQVEPNRTGIMPEIAFSSADGSGELVEEPLMPLSSTVVKISLKDTLGYWSVVADSDSHKEELHYKVYVQGEDGCKEVPDGARSIEGGDVATHQTLYVVVSNVGFEQHFFFTVKITGS